MKTLEPATRRRLLRVLVVAQVILVPLGLVILFYMLVQRLPLVELRSAAAAVIASFGLGLAGYALFAVRLAYVLRAFRITLARTGIWHVHLTSLFYYFFLPAGIGYDFSKIAKITSQVPDSRTGRVAAVAAADRAAGGIGMYLLLLAALPLTKLTPDSRLEWLIPPLWGWLILAAAVPAAGWTVAYLGRRRGACWSIPLLLAVGVSAMAYLLVAGAIWFVGHSLAVPVIFPEVVVALAATLLLQLVPVNVLGVTLGEVAAVTVYLAYGLDKPEALLMVTVAYTHRLVSAVIGGLMEWRNALHALRATNEAPIAPASGGAR